jgi:hypothetical protein
VTASEGACERAAWAEDLRILDYLHYWQEAILGCRWLIEESGVERGGKEELCVRVLCVRVWL